MGRSTGLDAQLGFALEVTKNTRVAPAAFIPFVSEGIQDSGSQPIPLQGLRALKTLHGYYRGKRDVGGPIAFEVPAQSIGKLLRGCFGSVNTTGTGPYTHVFTRGPLPSLSMQVGWQDAAATTYRKDYRGVLIDTWSLSVNPNQVAQMQLGIRAFDEQNDAFALATPTYSTYDWLTFASASIEVDNVAVCFDTVTLNGANNLYQSPAICATDAYATEYHDDGVSVWSGTFTTDFTDWTYYDLFTAGTAASFELILNAGASAQLSFVGNVVLTGSTPVVSGPEVIKQTVPFTFMVPDGGDEADALTVTLVNGDSAP